MTQGSRDGDGRPGTEADAEQTPSVRLKDGFGRRTVKNFSGMIFIGSFSESEPEQIQFQNPKDRATIIGKKTT